MSTFICLALLIISVITNDTTVLLASGLFAIAAEISVAFDHERQQINILGHFGIRENNVFFNEKQIAQMVEHQEKFQRIRAGSSPALFLCKKKEKNMLFYEEK